MVAQFLSHPPANLALVGFSTGGRMLPLVLIFVLLFVLSLYLLSCHVCIRTGLGDFALWVSVGLIFAILI